MFDRTFIQPTRTEYVDRNVTVTEKRAPTDESVKLLAEMEEAARARITNRWVTTLEDNKLSSIVVEMKCDTWKQLVMFTLNGETIHLELDPSRDARNLADWAEQAVTQISREIAVRVVKHALNAARKF